MGRPLYLKLYLTFLGVLLAIAIGAAGTAWVLGRSFALVRAGPRVAMHLARSLPAPDERAALKREVDQASEELGLDLTVVSLEGEVLASAGSPVEVPPAAQLAQLRAPAWIAPNLVAAPLRARSEEEKARSGDELKRAVDVEQHAAQHAVERLAPPLAPAPPRFEERIDRGRHPGPPGWEVGEGWGPGERDRLPPLAVVLVRMPGPGNPAQAYRVRNLILIALALALSAALLYPLSRSIVRPIEQLTDAAEAFGKGELGRRSGIRGGDEVGRLAKSFDEMAGRIETARRAEKELLANVSHELRTPLARMTVALEMIEPPPGPEGEAVRKRLSGLGEEITELTTLVSDVLTASRLELAAVPLQLRPIQLRPLLERSRDRALALSPQVVQLEVPDGLAVHGDEALLGRVLDNLLDNCRKYAGGDAAVVRVAARAEGAAVLISVSDQGPGFPPEDLPYVFDPFFRGQNAGGRAGGYGLGLAIAKRVAVAHGGTISARNLEGRGAQLELRLPG